MRSIRKEVSIWNSFKTLLSSKRNVKLFFSKNMSEFFIKKISANCFEDPAVFPFIFLYDCFRPYIKQKLVWSSISFVNNSYRLLIILITSKQINKRIHAFSISNTFISNTRLRLANNYANAKQHAEPELLTKKCPKNKCVPVRWCLCVISRHLCNILSLIY